MPTIFILFFFYFTFYQIECGFPSSGRISQYDDWSVFKSCNVNQLEGKICKKNVKTPNEETEERINGSTGYVE